jgi:MFS transporter, PAT family, beta-lactamase induction signal transducer AmpG
VTDGAAVPSNQPAGEPASRRGRLRAFLRSRRLLAVVLLSFSSGFPLGVVWFAIPTWLKQEGVDIRVVGLFTLAQAPWSFKVLWSPLMDRYPLPFLGRKRGWILASQVVLVGLGLWLAGISRHPEAVWIIGAVTLATAFASATHDIAYDAYTVEVLHTDEHGIAVGARTALYRAAMLVSGGVAITLASSFDVEVAGRHLFHWPGSWPLVNLLMATCYLPLMLVTVRAPEPESLPEPPRTLREAVWGPFVGFLAQHRSLEILSFVVLYKLGDNLTQALTRPFLVEVGFNPFDVGVATATIGQAAAIGGTFLGAVLTPRLGLGRSLWMFGFLQIFSNLGYAAVAQVGVNRPLMYAAQAFEHISSGLGSGAFGVLLLRLTQKRFSATQFALLSSLFTLPRVLAGPPAGYLAATIGWRDFFILTVFTGIPGLLMLARFVPWGGRDPEFHVEAPARGSPLSRWGLLGRASLAGILSWLVALLLMAGMGALSTLKTGSGWQWGEHLRTVLAPQNLGGWLTALGILMAGIFGGLATAAILVARRGLRPAPAP